MTHLELTDIIVFSGESMEEEERQRIQEHLDSCAVCRSRLISLNTFRSALSNIPDNLDPFELTDSCIPTELMGDFLGGRLAQSEYGEYSTHVDGCEYCFERAAYFTHSSVKMAVGALHSQGTPEKFIRAVVPEKIVNQQEAKKSFGKIALRFFRSPVPAYSLAASLLFFMVLGNGGGPDGIVDLNSNESFVIYEKPAQSGPSFGFSDAGRKVGKADAGLNVEKTSDGKLRFTWKSVKGAEEYHFSIGEVKPNGFEKVYDQKAVTPLVMLDISMIKTGKAYRWSVRGETVSNNIFSATGLFTITE